MRLSLLTLFIILISLAIPVLGENSTYVSLDEAKKEVEGFFSSANENNLIIILGSKISLGDQIFFNIMKTQINVIRDERFYPDTSIESIDQLNETYIVLLGSEKTNILSNQVITNETIDISKTLVSPPIILVFGLDNTTGKKILILYTLKEKYNNLNKAVERSPLNAILDKRFIPVTATAISLIFIYIWNIFSTTIVELISDYTSESIIERIIAKHKRKEITIRRYIDSKEGFSILLSSIVFSIAMSWAWSEKLDDFLWMFIINLIVIGLILLLKESVRQYFCYQNNLKAKHVFWPFGAILTVISTFLGNTFSLASYTLREEKEEIERKFGRIIFLISLMLFTFSIIIFILNLFYPDIIFQMMFTYTIMMLVIDLFPLPPMDGSDIRKWSSKKWFTLYIIVVFFYISVNFTFLF
ncbi:MAG TPA: hypothetical protein ENI44_03865 [Thermoplasmatales archaeon]|nr:hypothetical protein [Thermoplasmatales archaeon]